MRLFNNRTKRIISGGALLGGVYGLVATVSRTPTSLLGWDILVPFVCGALLLACGSSASCRWVRIYNLLRKSQTPSLSANQRTCSPTKSNFAVSTWRAVKFPNAVRAKRDSVELLICHKLNRDGFPFAVRRQRISRDELKFLLDEVMKDCVIE